MTVRHPERTLPALLLGGLVGAFVIGAEFAMANLLTGGASVDVEQIGLAVVLMLLTSFFAAPVFVIGFFGVGWPVWAMLHRLGLTSPWVAAGAGAVGVTAAGTSVLIAVGAGVTSLVLAFLMPGAVAGLTVWRVAYGRPKPPPARPS